VRLQTIIVQLFMTCTGALHCAVSLIFK